MEVEDNVEVESIVTKPQEEKKKGGCLKILGIIVIVWGVIYGYHYYFKAVR